MIGYFFMIMMHLNIFNLQGQPARFVFRQNKFKADPTLPFNALAMPAFDLVKDLDCDDCIESNHFLCDCNKVYYNMKIDIKTNSDKVNEINVSSISYFFVCYRLAGS